MSDPQIVVRLPKELDDRLRRYAAASDRTLAQVVRQALRRYLDTVPPEAS